MLRRSLLACAFACLSVLPLAAPAAADDRAAVIAARDAFAAAYNADDAAAMGAMHTADALVMPFNRPIYSGPAGATEFWTGSAKRGRDLKLETSAVEFHGDVALEFGLFSLILATDDKGDVPLNGKYLHVWRREPDGVWRMRADIWNQSPPQGS
jgi:ketosteroid isomerase-like protein